MAKWVKTHNDLIMTLSEIQSLVQNDIQAVDQLILLMVAEDGQIEIFKEDTKDYLPLLDEMMQSFYNNLDVDELIA